MDVKKFLFDFLQYISAPHNKSLYMPWDGRQLSFAFERGVGANIVKNQINTTFGPKWQGPEWFSILAEKLQIFKWS